MLKDANFSKSVGKNGKIRVWDIARKRWILAFAIDAKEMLAAQTASLDKPESDDENKSEVSDKENKSEVSDKENKPESDNGGSEVSIDVIEAMTRKELERFVQEYKLDVDLDQYANLQERRTAVIETLLTESE